MFVRYFILALIAGGFGSLISIVYTSMFGGIVFDFGGLAPSMTYIIAYNFMFTIGLCLLMALFSKVIKNKNIGEFIVNFLTATVCIMVSFLIVLYGFPEFEVGSDAEMMGFEFFGLSMPLVFVPALSWFAFKPLFNRNDN